MIQKSIDTSREDYQEMIDRAVLYHQGKQNQ